MLVLRLRQSGDAAAVVYSVPYRRRPASSLPQAREKSKDVLLQLAALKRFAAAVPEKNVTSVLRAATLQLIHGCPECLWCSSKEPIPRACSFAASSTIAWIDERAVFQRASRFRLSVRQATHSARRAIASAIFLLCPGWKSALG